MQTIWHFSIFTKILRVSCSTKIYSSRHYIIVVYTSSENSIVSTPLDCSRSHFQPILCASFSIYVYRLRSVSKSVNTFVIHSLIKLLSCSTSQLISTVSTEMSYDMSFLVQKWLIYCWSKTCMAYDIFWK